MKTKSDGTTFLFFVLYYYTVYIVNRLKVKRKYYLVAATLIKAKTAPRINRKVKCIKEVERKIKEFQVPGSVRGTTQLLRSWIPFDSIREWP